jgi:hypothetical protein
MSNSCKAHPSLPSAVPCPETFTALGYLPELISLDAARCSSELVYHSVAHLPEAQRMPSLPEFFTEGIIHMKLIPLHVARETAEIKYRREGFEMQEAKKHLVAIRADLFD